MARLAADLLVASPGALASTTSSWHSPHASAPGVLSGTPIVVGERPGPEVPEHTEIVGHQHFAHDQEHDQTAREEQPHPDEVQMVLEPFLHAPPPGGLGPAERTFHAERMCGAL